MSSASSAQTCVPRIYKGVIDDVVDAVREAFLDENVDEQVLYELRHLWEAKVAQSKAISPATQPDHLRAPVAPQLHSAFTVASLSAGASSSCVDQPYEPRRSDFRTAAALAAGARQPPGLAIVTLPVGVSQHHGAPFIIRNQPIAAPLGVVRQQMSDARGAGPNEPGMITISANQIRQGYGLAQRVAAAKNPNLPQLDGPAGGVSDDDDDDDEYVDVEDITGDVPYTSVSALVDAASSGPGTSATNDADDDIGEPLNSEDDISGEDPNELFEADNVVVCQYDKVTRARNRWRFTFKDGVMNLDGRDYVFQKATGEAEW